MTRVEINCDGGGHIAMMLEDDGPVSFARVIALASAVTVPATITIVPIPPDVTGRMAMFWFPKRTPTKESNGKSP